MNKYEILGWCPTPLRPAISGDGLTARIYPKLGLLSANQLINLAKLSLTYGNGELNLSNRAGFQIRGISERNYPAFLDGLIRLKLVKPSQAFFNITTTPFWMAKKEYSDLFDKIQNLMSKLSELPDKFGITIDIEKTPYLGEISADIRLEKAHNNKFIVRAGNSDFGLLVSLAEAPDLIYQISEWFLSSGGSNSTPGRMKSHISKGLEVPHFGKQKVSRKKNAPIPKLGKTKNGILVGLPFGEVSAKTLLDIAKFGSNIRLTPWRMLLLENQDKIINPNLITNYDDPILKFTACVGKPRCIQANTDVRKLAKSIACNKNNFVQLTNELSETNTVYHISGCAKGCANPKTATVTFVAKPKNKYDVIYNGTTKNPPKFYGVSEKTIVDNTLDYLKVPNDP